MRQHALSSVVTALAVALASGLVLSVYAIEAQSRLAFTQGHGDYDAVLGAKGAPLQLVLNTVFHLESSPGNVPWSLYEEARRDGRVERAVPYAVGDVYAGFRVVGTTPEAFASTKTGADGRIEGGSGRLFDPACQEAVLGSFVAQRTGLRVGDSIHPSHDLMHEHREEYLVVGILAPSNTPADHVVWIPIEGVFRMHEIDVGGDHHAVKPTEDVPDGAKEVSAVMLKLRSPATGLLMRDEYETRHPDATFAYPVGTIVAGLFDKLGWVHKVLALVANLVCVVAGASLLASLHNTISERRREFAILRALGAGRSTVFAAIVAEAAAISAAGALAGFAVYAAILLAAAAVVRAETGVVVDAFRFHPALVVVPVAMTALGALCGLVPAWKAYRTDVASNLAPAT